MAYRAVVVAFLFAAFSSYGVELKEKDLGVLLPIQSRYIINVTGEPNLEKIFSKSWLRQVNEAFEETSIGSSLETENIPEDWQLVSLRIVPCSPLGTYPHQDIGELCWPEIRQVWQPILRDKKIRWNVKRPFYADDRAIHALYDTSLLKGDVQLLQKIRNLLQSYHGQKSIDSELRVKFLERRDIAVARFIKAVSELRQYAAGESSYSGFSYRPEMNGEKEEKNFILSLSQFLSDWAPSASLKAMTAFSLPEGRTPAHTDEWKFLSFRGEKGQLVQENITVKLLTEDETVIDIGKSEFVSMRRDDPAFYDIWYEADELQLKLMKQSLFLFEDDRHSLKDVIADRRQTLVPNTSCGSCHKFNELNFNLHNYSYLEDWSASVSPRTKKDIELDLSWLKSWLERKKN